MKISTKQYKYAPENLEIYLNNKLLDKSYYKNLGYEFYKSNNKINFIRKNILNKFNNTNKKLVKIDFLHNKEDYQRFNKSYSGYINSYKELKTFINNMKVKHNLSDIIKINFIFKSNFKKGIKWKSYIIQVRLKS